MSAGLETGATMTVASQAAVEYAALAIRRATTTLGVHFGRVQDFVSDHFLATLLILLGFVVLLAMRPGSAGRRR